MSYNIIITGGSDGLGRVTAEQILKQFPKAHVILLSRNKDKLKRANRELSKFGNVAYYTCDISKPHQVKNVIEKITKKYKTIDVLINNAGIWVAGDITETDDEKLQQLFNTNTLGYFYVTKYVLPIMRKQKKGSILNVISIAGIDYEEGWAPYVASKHAIRAFSQLIRKNEVKFNIKVMSIYPGGMDTDFFKKAGRNVRHEEWMLDPKYVANVICFMLNQPDDVILNHVEVRKFKFS